jgi:hypothetical protein
MVLGSTSPAKLGFPALHIWASAQRTFYILHIYWFSSTGERASSIAAQPRYKSSIAVQQRENDYGSKNRQPIGVRLFRHWNSVTNAYVERPAWIDLVENQVQNQASLCNRASFFNLVYRNLAAEVQVSRYLCHSCKTHRPLWP